jgi:hypothetical protein
MFSRGPQPTIGQYYATSRKNFLEARANSFKTYVVPQFIKDIHTKITADQIKNPQQQVFVYTILDIINDKNLYTNGAFLKAIVSAEPTPFDTEITQLATAFVESAKGQDFEARFGEETKTITIDITNVETIAAQRIADAEIIRKQKEEEATKMAAIRGAADKIAATESK